MHQVIGSLRALSGRAKRHMLQALDLLAMACCALLTPYAFAGLADGGVAAAALAGGVGVGLLQWTGAYKAIVSESDPIDDWWRYAAAAGLSVGGYQFAAGESLRVIVLAVLAAVVLMLSLRLAARRSAYTGPPQGKRTAIYGAGGAGVQLAAALDRSREAIVCFFVDDDASLWRRSIGGRKIVPSDKLAAEIAASGVTDLIVAIPSLDAVSRQRLIARISTLPLRINIAPDLREILSGRALTSYRPLRIDELLGREPVAPISKLVSGSVEGECVLVTGAGGSIGGELCRQISMHGPRKMVLLDASEHALYEIDRKLRGACPDHEITAVLGSVTDPNLVAGVLEKNGVTVIFHAAAYKHVPLVESNVTEGIRNNVLGTLNVVRQAELHQVRKFVLISTDKAVRPTNVMGASKRMCELILQARAAIGKAGGPVYCIVRFGNVLGSSGSVVPLFEEQIDRGGPVTLTHPDVTRYFMSIPEAAQLVLQAATISTNGDLFVLDMGKPVRIADLARLMIHLRGFVETHQERSSAREIQISVTGLRPGEKLYEELLLGDNVTPTIHPKISRAKEELLEWDEIESGLNKLSVANHSSNVSEIKRILSKYVSGYKIG